MRGLTDSAEGFNFACNLGRRVGGTLGGEPAAFASFRRGLGSVIALALLGVGPGAGALGVGAALGSTPRDVGFGRPWCGWGTGRISGWNGGVFGAATILTRRVFAGCMILKCNLWGGSVFCINRVCNPWTGAGGGNFCRKGLWIA
ncbi:MAG: hypothetical protein O3A90_17615 [Proteobacteria bacterium]|nr:hypothetical protein [Pseudomonadota bacterium]